jgi:hypothetical protein
LLLETGAVDGLPIATGEACGLPGDGDAQPTAIATSVISALLAQLCDCTRAVNAPEQPFKESSEQKIVSALENVLLQYRIHLRLMN